MRQEHTTYAARSIFDLDPMMNNPKYTFSLPPRFISKPLLPQQQTIAAAIYPTKLPIEKLWEENVQLKNLLEKQEPLFKASLQLNNDLTRKLINLESENKKANEHIKNLICDLRRQEYLTQYWGK